MAFCENCGMQISDVAKFCSNCGKVIVLENTDQANRPNEIYDGKVRKCPSCGSVWNSFESTCKYCGYELRDTTVTSSITEFTHMLDAANNAAHDKGSSVFSIFASKKVDAESLIAHKSDIIMTFAVPNTKEDVLEFLILATTSINTDVYGSTADFSGGFRGKKKFENDTTLANAWVAKIEQVYQKAKLSFGNDQSFKHIQEIYEKCMLTISNEKRKRRRKKAFWIIMISIFAGWPIWIWPIIGLYKLLA